MPLQRVVQTRTSTADVLFIKKVPRIYYYSDTDAEHTDILASMLGCTDVEACNYDETAMVSFGCTYPEPHRNCAGDCINDADGDNICDEADSCVGSIDMWELSGNRAERTRLCATSLFSNSENTPRVLC